MAKMRTTITLPDYGSKKLKDLAVLIHKVDSVLRFVLAIYPTEWVQMLFAKRILLESLPPRGIRIVHGNQGAIILYSWVDQTKHCTNVVC